LSGEGRWHSSLSALSGDELANLMRWSSDLEAPRDRAAAEGIRGGPPARTPR